jgi:inhibitor of cysteine peptidase
MSTSTRKSTIILMSLMVLALALGAFAAVGCGSGADNDAVTTTVPSTDGTTTDSTTIDAALSLAEADNGKAFTLNVGDTMTVTLAGNPTTGYEWTADLTDEAAALLVAAEDDPAYLADTVDPNVVGSGGMYTFTFTAAAAGQVELKLKYWRSFEPDTAPVQTFTATITIQ